MRSFLRSTRDHAAVWIERERPYFSLGALSMYTLALVAEIPVIFARFLLWLLVVGVAMAIENGKGHVSLLFVVFIPTLWSISALFRPVGGAWWWRTRAGGREPSQRERLVYQDAVELLQSYTPKPLPLPRRWFVLDTTQPDAAACGDTLMLSRTLLETDHLPAVLAHELGHLGSPDGRLTAAINASSSSPSPSARPTQTTQNGTLQPTAGAAKTATLTGRHAGPPTPSSTRPLRSPGVSAGSCSKRRCSPKADSGSGSPARSGVATGAGGSTRPTNTPPPSAKLTS
jgi:hypothetical protein